MFPDFLVNSVKIYSVWCGRQILSRRGKETLQVEAIGGRVRLPGSRNSPGRTNKGGAAAVAGGAVRLPGRGARQ